EAQQPMLILLDQPIEQVGVAAAQATSDLGILVLHPVRVVAGGRVHATHSYGREGEKDASRKWWLRNRLGGSDCSWRESGRAICLVAVWSIRGNITSMTSMYGVGRANREAAIPAGRAGSAASPYLCT